MASTRTKADPQQQRQRRGNDEQEAGYPYGGERTPQRRPKPAYLTPKREADVAKATTRAPRARKASAKPKRRVF
jgi:hypothetical protein